MSGFRAGPEPERGNFRPLSSHFLHPLYITLSNGPWHPFKHLQSLSWLQAWVLYVTKTSSLLNIAVQAAFPARLRSSSTGVTYSSATRWPCEAAGFRTRGTTFSKSSRLHGRVCPHTTVRILMHSHESLLGRVSAVQFQGCVSGAIRPSSRTISAHGRYRSSSINEAALGRVCSP